MYVYVKCIRASTQAHTHCDTLTLTHAHVFGIDLQHHVVRDVFYMQTKTHKHTHVPVYLWIERSWAPDIRLAHTHTHTHTRTHAP